MIKTRTKYVNFSPGTIEKARQMDLLTYLRTYEPDNLVRVTSNVYCTREHDSLKISNGKWYWWSRGFGGVSALDYLMKVRGISFVEAVQQLTGEGMTLTPVPQEEKKIQPKPLYLPPKHENCNQVMAYLRKRGIDHRVIQDCIDAGLLYESAPYHNAVFIGRDDNGQPRYAACRSTIGSSFKRDASGSDKRFSFRLLAQKPCTSVNLFEAAIDLLSFATYLQCGGGDYRIENLLSLSGVYQPKADIKSSKIPVALSEFLKKNPSVRTIYLHLDNDKAGRLSTAALTELLKSEYEIVDAPPPIGKDVNDFYCIFYGMSRKNPIEGSVIQDDDTGSKAAGTVLASIDFEYPKSKLRGKSPETPYLQKGRN